MSYNRTMSLQIYTDGGCINNPGPAACAFVVYQDGKLIFSESQAIGKTTNNIAEYTALIRALEWVKNFLFSNFHPPAGGPASNVQFFSDSALMINQLNGYFKVKNAAIRELIMKIRVLEGEVKTAIVYKNIPREKNALADSLVKKELKNS